MNRTFTMQQPKRAAALNIRTITMTALLSAMAYVLAFVEFPVPLSPSFARMDLSDFPALIGAFLPFIHTKLDIVLFNALPFNILKGLVIDGFTMLTYKRLTPILKGRGSYDETRLFEIAGGKYPLHHRCHHRSRRASADPCHRHDAL